MRNSAPAWGWPQTSMARKKLERVKGIEPSYSAWKAAALPLSYTRVAADQLSRHRAGLNRHAPRTGSAWTCGRRAQQAAAIDRPDMALLKQRTVIDHIADAVTLRVFEFLGERAPREHGGHA